MANLETITPSTAAKRWVSWFISNPANHSSGQTFNIQSSLRTYGAIKTLSENLAKQYSSRAWLKTISQGKPLGSDGEWGRSLTALDYDVDRLSTKSLALNIRPVIDNQTIKLELRDLNGKIPQPSIAIGDIKELLKKPYKLKSIFMRAIARLITQVHKGKLLDNGHESELLDNLALGCVTQVKDWAQNALKDCTNDDCTQFITFINPPEQKTWANLVAYGLNQAGKLVSLNKLDPSYQSAEIVIRFLSNALLFNLDLFEKYYGQCLRKIQEEFLNKNIFPIIEFLLKTYQDLSYPVKDEMKLRVFCLLDKVETKGLKKSTHHKNQLLQNLISNKIRSTKHRAKPEQLGIESQSIRAAQEAINEAYKTDLEISSEQIEKTQAALARDYQSSKLWQMVS